MAKDKIILDGQNRLGAILSSWSEEREIVRKQKIHDAMKFDYRNRKYFKPRLDTSNKDK